MCSVCVGGGLVSCWKSLIWTGCVYWYVFPGFSVTSVFFAFEVGEKGWKRGLYIGINMFTLFFQGISKFEVLTSFECGKKHISNVTQADLRKIPRDPISPCFKLAEVPNSFRTAVFQSRSHRNHGDFGGHSSWFHLVHLGYHYPPKPSSHSHKHSGFLLEISRFPPKKHAISMSPPGGHETMFVFASCGGVRSKV